MNETCGKKVSREGAMLGVGVRGRACDYISDYVICNFHCSYYIITYHCYKVLLILWPRTYIYAAWVSTEDYRVSTPTPTE